MPWIAVNPAGYPIAFAYYCPSASLVEAFDHKVTAEDLVHTTEGMRWQVQFGWGRDPVDGGFAAAAWYKVISVPCPALGRFAWEVSVSYWSYNPKTQWL